MYSCNVGSEVVGSRGAGLHSVVHCSLFVIQGNCLKWVLVWNSAVTSSYVCDKWANFFCFLTVQESRAELAAKIDEVKEQVLGSDWWLWFGSVILRVGTRQVIFAWIAGCADEHTQYR